MKILDDFDVRTTDIVNNSKCLVCCNYYAICEYDKKHTFEFCTIRYKKISDGTLCNNCPYKAFGCSRYEG